MQHLFHPNPMGFSYFVFVFLDFKKASPCLCRTFLTIKFTGKVERIIKGSLDLIPSPSPSVKIQIIGGKVCLKCWVMSTNFLYSKVCWQCSKNLPLNLKHTFPPIIWIFTVGEGDGIESRLPFKISSTLKVKSTMIYEQQCPIQNSTADSWNLRDGWWGRNFPSHKKNLWYYCIMGWINFWRRRNHKDHLILKGLLGFFNFPKKRKKHFCPSRLRQK